MEASMFYYLSEGKTIDRSTDGSANKNAISHDVAMVFGSTMDEIFGSFGKTGVA